MNIKTKPTKYRKELCKEVIDYMSSGNSFCAFGVHIDVCHSTLYEWLEKYPEFRKAYEKAKKACQKWFEDRMRISISGQDVKGIDTKKIDKTLLIFALKTRFHETYGDKKEVTIKGQYEQIIDYLNVNEDTK